MVNWGNFQKKFLCNIRNFFSDEIFHTLKYFYPLPELLLHKTNNSLISEPRNMMPTWIPNNLCAQPTTRNAKPPSNGHPQATQQQSAPGSLAYRNSSNIPNGATNHVRQQKWQYTRSGHRKVRMIRKYEKKSWRKINKNKHF